MIDRQTDIFIDALALVPERKSGVGYSIEQTLLCLAQLPQNSNRTIYLVVPLGKAKHLQRYVEGNVKTKTIYLPARIMELLLRLNVFPPIDWLLGFGIYIFPNYRNFPVWRSRSLTYIYDVAFIKHPEMVQPKNQKYLQHYVTRWLGRSSKIIAISNAGRTEIEKYLAVPSTNIEMVYCGVDSNIFYKRQELEVARVKKVYGIDYDKYFLFVSTIEPRKNILSLLDAYDALPLKVKQTYGLVLVGGTGWLNEAVYDRLAALQKKGLQIQKVDTYVMTEDLPAIYSGATLLIHPAYYEGFGMTPLEAMACETPVIVSDIPAIREVVRDSAVYFNPLTADSLTESITHALINPTLLEKNVKAGRLRAQQLSWMTSAESLQQVIEGQLGQKTGRPLVSRLKYIYSVWDVRIRSFCGEKVLEAYKPSPAASRSIMRQEVHYDYLHDQPNYVQAFLLKVYLQTKHLLFKGLVGAYLMARRA